MNVEVATMHMSITKKETKLAIGSYGRLKRALLLRGRGQGHNK